jgi:hypothetical protein
MFEAARHYATLEMINPRDESFRLRRLVSSAYSAKILGGLDNGLGRESDFVELAIRAGTRSNSQALQMAMDDGHVPATIGLSESIGMVGDSLALEGIDGQPSPLAIAMSHANPRVRFAAAEAVARIGPKKSFAGNSRLAETLAHFGSSTGRRSALIAHPRIAVAQSIAGLLNQAGFDADVVISSKDMLSRSTDSADYEFFIVSDAFRQPETSQLIQLLRRNPLTAALPIGVLARSQEFSDAAQMAESNPMVITLPETKGAATIARVVRQLEELAGRAAVPADRRGQMAASALEHLAVLAQQNQLQGTDLSRFVHQIKRSSTTRGLAPHSIALLGTIGSPEAQSHLLKIANQDTLPIDHRESAGKAFDKSVGKFGVMLTRAQIITQYNVFNASEPLGPPTQQLLGAVLDTIENRLTN